MMMMMMMLLLLYCNCKCCIDELLTFVDNLEPSLEPPASPTIATTAVVAHQRRSGNGS